MQKVWSHDGVVQCVIAPGTPQTKNGRREKMCSDCRVTRCRGEILGSHRSLICSIGDVFGLFSGMCAKNGAMHADEKARSFVPEPLTHTWKLRIMSAPKLRSSLWNRPCLCDLIQFPSFRSVQKQPQLFEPIAWTPTMSKGGRNGRNPNKEMNRFHAFVCRFGWFWRENRQS